MFFIQARDGKHMLSIVYHPPQSWWFRSNQRTMPSIETDGEVYLEFLFSHWQKMVLLFICICSSALGAHKLLIRRKQWNYYDESDFSLQPDSSLC